MATYQEPVGGLISADFIPNILEHAGLLNWATYERFPEIVARANQWLSRNPGLEIRTCETVEFNVNRGGEMANVVNSVFRTYGDSAVGNRYVRGLRLWIQPRLDGRQTVQQIGYYNIMPTIRSGFFTTEASDRLDSLVQKTNQLFQSNPLPGKIVTIETVALKIKNDTPDPDATSWTERTGYRQHFAIMIRVFYVHGPPAYETIGIADFTPATLEQGGFFSRPILESFPQVLSHAQHWLLQQPPNFHFVNAQTLLFKQKYDNRMDTLRMLYTNNDLNYYYVRYIRVAFVLSGQQANSPVRLRMRLFLPGMLEAPGMMSVGSYENQIQVRERMCTWMKATGAKVLSVETVPMRMFSGAEAREGFDTMHTWEKARSGRNNNTRETFLIMYRCYVDGDYAEPAGITELPSVEGHMRSGEPCSIA